MGRITVEWLPADLGDRRSVVSRIAAGPGPAVAVTEGPLIYLAPQDVAALARGLHACLARRLAAILRE